MNEVGQYIKKLRKEKGMTQNQLADRLNITFQSVSKWETGETLPDTSILLDLCNELDTTVDTLLNGGVIVNKTRKLVKVEAIVEGFNHLTAVKGCFGEDSIFYKCLIEGANNKMNFDFADALKNYPEVLYTEIAINYILNGYTIDIEEAKKWIKNEKYINEIKKRLN